MTKACNLERHFANATQRGIDLAKDGRGQRRLLNRFSIRTLRPIARGWRRNAVVLAHLSKSGGRNSQALSNLLSRRFPNERAPRGSFRGFPS